MGDVIHCLPLAARIKKRLPGVELTWLVEPAAADLLLDNPVLDRVLVLPRKAWLKGLSRFAPAAGSDNKGTIFNTFGTAKKYFAELKTLDFDLVIDAQGLLKSAIPAFLSGAPRRVGFAGTREGAEQLLTHRLEVGDYFDPNRHVVELNMALADYALEVLAQETGTCLRLTGRDHTAHFPLPEPSEAAVAKVSGRLAQLTSAMSAGVTPGVQAPSDGEPVVVPGPEAPESAPESPPGSISGEAPDSAPDSKSRLAPDPTLVSKVEAPRTSSPATDSPAIYSPVIALIPGTTWVTKIWPAEYWTSLGRLLIQRLGARVVICGGPADATMNQSIYKGIDSTNANAVIDLTGETNLMELVALFKKCDLVIGGDTGPLHLAAAVASSRPDMKVVAIHGATPWLRNGPYGDMCTTVHLNLECQPCFEKTCRIKTLACLKDLPVEEVFKTAMRMLNSQVVKEDVVNDQISEDQV